MAPSAFPKFGRLALETGAIQVDQLRQCLAVQIAARRAGQDPPHLGQVMVDQKLLSIDQVRQLLRIQKSLSRAEAAAPAGSILSFTAGEVLFRQGQENRLGLGILLEGTVELRRGGEALAVRDKKGMFLGEISALVGGPHAVTAIALTACRLSQIEPGQIGAFLRSRPAIALKMAESLALYCRRAMEISAAAVPLEQTNEPQTQTTKPVPPSLLNLTSMASVSIEDGGQLVLKDVADTAATFINGFPVRGSMPLHDQDLVQIGRHVFQVHLDHPHRIKLADGPNAAVASDAQAPSSEVLSPPPAEEPPPPLEAPPAPQELAEGQTVDSAIAAEIDALVAVPFPQEVLAAVEARLAPCVQIVELEVRRTELARSDDGRDTQVEQELARQLREVQRIPPADALEKALAKVHQELAARPSAPLPVEASEPDAAADDDAEFAAPDEDDADETDPAAGTEAPAPAPAPALTAALRAALELSLAQKQHLLQRAKLTQSTLRACAAVCIDEPLYRIFARYEIAGEDLFGWAAYATALQELRHHRDERLADIRLQRQAAKGEARSIMLGAARSVAAQAAVSELAVEEHDLAALITAIGREQRAIQREMVEEFWNVYSLAAVKLVEGVAAAHAPYLRAFLRWGLLGCSARFVEPALAKRLLVECAGPAAEPMYKGDSTHVLYADEIIDLAARGLIPPSPNEDLELNHANTPAWRADRAWRRQIAHRIQKSIHQDMHAQLSQTLTAEKRAQEDAQKRLAMVNAKGPKAAEKRAGLKDEIQQHKVEAARKERLADIMATQLLPRLDEKLELARKGLADSGIRVTPAMLAEHEATCMRQYARLANKLAEPFLPLSLAEQFGRAGDCINDRSAIAAAVADMEKLDPLLFCEPMVQGVKKMHRVLLRYSPIVAIAPGPGIMAISICPRTDADHGMFVMPATFSRPGLRAEALRDVLADYRFDTSKASAGVDIMTSDTLVAAYAEYRWNMRKRDRDIRQKAGIYTEENDRNNWRRHYEYYIKSATDAGKQLFFRSPELYERIIGKFIDLPDGQEMLKKA